MQILFGDKESTRPLPFLSDQDLIKTEQFPLTTDCTLALEGWTAMGAMFIRWLRFLL